METHMSHLHLVRQRKGMCFGGKEGKQFHGQYATAFPPVRSMLARQGSLFFRLSYVRQRASCSDH